MPKEYTDCVQRLMADGKTKAEAQKTCAIAFYKKHGKTPKEAEKMSEDLKQFAELSHDEKRTKVMEAIDSMTAGKTPKESMAETYPWVKEMYDDRVIVEVGGDLFEYPYTIAADGAVTMGEPKQVQVTYQELAELKGVEILKTGTHTTMDGTKVVYSEADLDEMMQNAEKLKDIVKPTIVVGHADGNESVLVNVQTVGSPQVGWMTQPLVKQKNEDGSASLLADFKDIAKLAVEKIGTDLKRVSSEIYNNFQHDGKAFGRVIRRVSFVPMPSIKDLSDVTQANLAFGEKPDQPTTWVSFTEEPPQSSAAASTPAPEKREEIIDMDIQELAEQVLTLNENQAKMQEQLDTKDARIKELEEKDKATVTKLSETEQQRKAQEIKRFCTDRFREGRVSPALLSLGLEQFMVGLDDSTITRFGEGAGKKTYDLTQLGWLKNFFMHIPRNAIVKLSELGAIGSDPNANNTGKTASERLTDATNELMKADNTLKFSEAFDRAQKENPDLAQEYAEEVTGQPGQ